MKTTVLTYPEDIQCRGCPATFAGSSDSARRHGWRIGWSPSMPTWCPQCGGPTTKRITVTATFNQTETLFDLKEEDA